MEDLELSLEDRCREIQGECDFVLPEKDYVILHIDGRAFSRYCKKMGFKKKGNPFSFDFVNAMNYTTEELCKEIGNCRLGFTQSDEITLILDPHKYRDGKITQEWSDPWFGNRVWKLSAHGAALASNAFNRYILLNICSREGTSGFATYKWAEFDCKCWNVSELNDVYAWLSYRSIDCIRNSKQQFCQAFMSYNELLGHTTDEQIELLIQKDEKLDWNKLDQGIKFGRLCYKVPTQVLNPITGEMVDRMKFQSVPSFPMVSQEGKKKFLDLNIIQEEL